MGLDFTKRLEMALFFFKAIMGGAGNNSFRIGSTCSSFQLSCRILLMAGVLSLKVFTKVRTGFESLGFLTRALALIS